MIASASAGASYDPFSSGNGFATFSSSDRVLTLRKDAAIWPEAGDLTISFEVSMSIDASMKYTFDVVVEVIDCSQEEMETPVASSCPTTFAFDSTHNWDAQNFKWNEFIYPVRATECIVD